MSSTSPSSLAASSPPWCAASKKPLPRFFTTMAMRTLPAAAAVPADMQARASAAAAIRIHFVVIVGPPCIVGRSGGESCRLAQLEDTALVRSHRLEPGEPHGDVTPLAVVIPDRAPRHRL